MAAEKVPSTILYVIFNQEVVKKIFQIKVVHKDVTSDIFQFQTNLIKDEEVMAIFSKV